MTDSNTEMFKTVAPERRGKTSEEVVAQLRDTQGYVLACALGKSIFDYHAEQTRSHQEDWAGLFRWLKKHA